VGNGVNKTVTLASTGNCFYRVFSGTVHYLGSTYTWYEYQNGAGHCLFANGTLIDVGAACADNHPNEEFFGVQLVSNGWRWKVNNGDISLFVDAPGCGVGAGVDLSSNPACGVWNF
jgi:hypothetical protein